MAMAAYRAIDRIELYRCLIEVCDMKKIYLVLVLFTALFILNFHQAFADQQDLIFVLDNSGSMHENDPDILTKSMVSAFIKELKKVDRVGIIIFDESARLAVPLTLLDTPASRKKLSGALNQINYHGQRTNTPAAIERAVYELRTTGRPDSRRSIVFLTDGIIDTGDASRDVDMTKWLIEDLTSECAGLEIKIFGVAFTEKADFHLIQSLAAKTDGAYFRSLVAKDISKAFNEIVALLNADTEDTVETIAAPMEPVEPLEPVNALEPVESLEMSSKSQSMHTNVTTVKINEEESDSLLSTLLWNFLWIIILIAAISFLSFPLYQIYKRKKAPQAKLPPPAPKKIDDLPEILPEAQLLSIYNTGGDNAEPNVLYLLDKHNITIGRASQNEIVISKSTVSNFHAAIEFVNGHFQIEDNNSTNGTFLAGNRLPPKQPVQLKHGDVLRFASFDFRFLHTNKALSSEETIMMTECLKIKI